jgi:GrpB-like predicted nucleotidyltransferase (UPF0157 family)
MDSLRERIQKAVQEDISIVPYNPQWLQMFEAEKSHLLSCLPHDLVKRVEHFGSTAIPGLSAKPIIDMLVEVTSLEETKEKIVPILTAQGYEYFWRPTWGDDIPPFYAWFIKRDMRRERTHHIHMIEKNFDHWDRLLFRDYLIENPAIAQEYQTLKLRLAKDFPNNRIAYSNAKTEFVLRVTKLAKKHYKQIESGGSV